MRLRNQVDQEAEFWRNHYKRGDKVGGWFERCLIRLAPFIRPALSDAGDRILSSLGDIKGKRICELGCGIGEFTAELVSKGAYVCAVDISGGAVKSARERIPIEQADIQQANAASLPYPIAFFDVVVGQNIIHHVDIDRVSTEICRVLKVGGRAVFIEPLAHNPIFNLYRKLTPSIRTPNERPLSYHEIRRMGAYFSQVHYQEFGLVAHFNPIVFLLTHNQKRATQATKLGALLLDKCGFLRKYCWGILLEFTK